MRYFTNKLIGITIPIANTAYRIPRFRTKCNKENVKNNNRKNNNPPLRSEMNCFLFDL